MCVLYLCFLEFGLQVFRLQFSDYNFFSPPATGYMSELQLRLQFRGVIFRPILNINILNHYIGMQFIKPDSIPELKYFPFVVYGMIFLGLISAMINNKWIYFSWFSIMIILGILGVYDFYLWMYDYGHNLDPNAPIKVPGMVYMPPLFGEKDLLNFYVKSYPHLGTVFLTLSILCSSIAFWVSRKKQSQ